MSLGNGLLTSEDDFWLRQRRIAQPAFHRQKVVGAGRRDGAGRARDGGRVAVDRVRRTPRGHLRRDDALHAHRRPSRAARRRSRPVRVEDRSGVGHINEHVGEQLLVAGHRRAVSTREGAAIRRGTDSSSGEAVDYVINERRRHPSDSADLLSMLMGARDEETGERMTDEQLRVEVTTFLLAGQETTSLALTWTWYLLSQHAGARQRLEHELDTVLDGRAARIRRPREPAVHANGGGRSDASVSTGVGLLAPGARRRHARRIPSAARMARLRVPVRAAPAAGSTGRIPRRSIPNASHPSAAPIARSSSTCRSAPDPGSASAISSR